MWLVPHGYTEMPDVKGPSASATSYDVCKAHGCSCFLAVLCRQSKQGQIHLLANVRSLNTPPTYLKCRNESMGQHTSVHGSLVYTWASSPSVLLYTDVFPGRENFRILFIDHVYLFFSYPLEFSFSGKPQKLSVPGSREGVEIFPHGPRGCFWYLAG